MEISVGRFEESKNFIYIVREIVFEKEQGVSRQLERDGKDKDCIHVLALDGRHQPVGTARLQPNGKIGRMAVLKSFRGRKIGGRMLNALINEATRQRMDKVMLNAQKTAIGFYEKFGFKPIGQPFLEADMWHVKMVRKLGGISKEHL